MMGGNVPKGTNGRGLLVEISLLDSDFNKIPKCAKR
jgi:hypothetical protein